MVVGAVVIDEPQGPRLGVEQPAPSRSHDLVHGPLGKGEDRAVRRRDADAAGLAEDRGAVAVPLDGLEQADRIRRGEVVAVDLCTPVERRERHGS
ncbi:hypothetical protein D3C74_407190 [compost metagenome]